MRWWAGSEAKAMVERADEMMAARDGDSTELQASKRRVRFLLAIMDGFIGRGVHPEPAMGAALAWMKSGDVPGGMSMEKLMGVPEEEVEG